MQAALNHAWNYALGMFEHSTHEDILIAENIFIGEDSLQDKWLSNISAVLLKAGLSIPSSDTWNPVLGGRKGLHTEHLGPLVEEMSEVFRYDPTAEW
jgi:ring-1,2-phenylacetyl-CoA epoxidase subunit PaaC